ASGRRRGASCVEGPARGSAAAAGVGESAGVGGVRRWPRPAGTIRPRAVVLAGRARRCRKRVRLARLHRTRRDVPGRLARSESDSPGSGSDPGQVRVGRPGSRWGQTLDVSRADTQLLGSVAGHVAGGHTESRPARPKGRSRDRPFVTGGGWEKPGYSASPSERSIAPFGCAPTTAAAGSPFLNRIIVGIDITP